MADETFGDSDHDTVKFVIVLEPTDNQTHVLADDTRFVWSKANFDLIDLYLFSIDWQLVLQNDPEALQFWFAVESTIYDADEIAVPKQTTPVYHSSMRRIPKKYPRIIRKLRVKNDICGGNFELTRTTLLCVQNTKIVLVSGESN